MLNIQLLKMRKTLFVMAGVILVLAAAGMVVGQTTITIPRITLSTDPLYAAAGGDKPAMALALSVEFPTVGAQYVAAPGQNSDSTYANTKEYLGYYDAESCYNYNNTPTETPATGLTAADYKRFDRNGPATNRMCANAFSGNFLNWASSSAIDMLRLALSGGDRYIDTNNLTILQRAVIPNGDPICMWNSGNFPAKQLQKDGGGAGKYWGAIPTSMITEANGNNVWVANTLNRIFFGTSNTGNCNDTTAYTLGRGSVSTSKQIGPIVNRYLTRTTGLAGFTGSTQCATEGGSCNFTGTQEVLYGAQGTSNTDGGWITFPATNGLNCTNDMTGSFVDPAPGTPKVCRIRPYTGSWKPTPATGVLNSDGFFYSRVQVCNSSSGTLADDRDYQLCTRYPNGNYKPTGSIQKYSDQLRLSAFGYVMEQTASYNNGRYGGVLRAPMKFVGAKTFDENGQENTALTGNPNAEWDTNTGVFAMNPDGDITQTKPISGVINYLNRFGRTGQVPGRYKTFDPVGELHYEVLRYLQGLQPSAAAVAGLTNPKSDLFDGFPVSTIWTDPYGGTRSNTADYSCLKSNIVVIGDANTHDGNRIPTANLAANIPDIRAWRSVVQNFERNISTSYIDGQGSSRLTSNPNTANNNPASSNDRSQILGSAYWSHTHDIRGEDWTNSPLLQRPGLRTKTFIFDVNEGASSNDESFRRNRNQLFTAAKYGGFESDASNLGQKPYNTYGNPFKKQDGTNDNDVWQDPARPGEASTFYLQSDARGVLAAFDSIFSRSASSARSIAGSSVGNSNLIAGGSLVYQASFDTTDWNGDVLAFPVSVAGGTAGLAAEPTWKAATRLEANVKAGTPRKIIVGRKGSDSNPTATAFTWTAIDEGLKTDLAKVTPTSLPDGAGSTRLDYLRGDRSKEPSPFRARSKLLGDIVNSGVVYSGVPRAPAGSTPGFALFKAANSARPEAVFVGANDGMLHAFNATSGNELFAYIPSAMGPKLAALTEPSYNSNHQSYVDATPVIAEAKVGTNDTATDWKTVLVSGMGGGAKGLFALDVSNPATFSASNVMWEFTSADDPDIGFIVGKPRIVKLRTSASNATTPTYKYFAAVASGVNNYVPNLSSLIPVSATGQPALFLLALDKAPGAAWTTGGSSPNYYKIVLPVDATLRLTNPPGLINFQTTLAINGETEFVYMGDLHGKLWKLDFLNGTATGPSDWTMAKLSAFNKGTLALPDPYPLYTAKTSTGAVQPITMSPLLVSGAVVQGLKTTIVGFGTGKYLESGDKTSTVQQSFYAVYDDGTSKADSSPVNGSAISSRARLQRGTVDTATFKVNVGAFRFRRTTLDTPTDTPPTRSGWYFDFPESGERMIMDGTLSGRTASLTTLIPASSGAVGSCTAAGGGGNSYEINIDSGNGSYERSTVGLLGQTLLIKISETDDKSDSTGRGERITKYQKIRIGSNGSSVEGPPVDLVTVNRRQSWRMINNYQDLKRGK